MTKALTLLLQLPIRFYRIFISPLLPPRCRFYPTCSSYGLTALQKHGPLKGLVLTARRMMRCHPWGGAHWHDPVPEAFAWRDLLGYKRGRSREAASPSSKSFKVEQ